MDGDAALAAGRRVFATPRHTPGHQSVLLTAEDDAVLFTGDLLVHTLQPLYPDLPSAKERDPAQARVSRPTWASRSPRCRPAEPAGPQVTTLSEVTARTIGAPAFAGDWLLGALAPHAC